MDNETDTEKKHFLKRLIIFLLLVPPEYYSFTNSLDVQSPVPSFLENLSLANTLAVLFFS